MKETRLLDPWMARVVQSWREHWEGTDHRYGQDFAAFVGERLMTDFDLREQEPYPFGHARPVEGKTPRAMEIGAKRLNEAMG